MGHSTEAVLTCIHNDILLAVNDKGCVIVVLKDLCAPFDTHTVDYDGYDLVHWNIVSE